MEASQPLDNDFRQDLGVTGDINAYLSEIAKWSKFLSIVGFIFIGLMVMIALFMGFFMGSALSSLPDETLGPLGSGLYSTGVTFFYLLLALLYFFPTLYLYRFSGQMKIALKNSDQSMLTEAFSNLKSVFKFMGIMTAVILGLYALILLVALVVGGAATFM